jgi:ATP-dependent helicase HrpB
LLARVEALDNFEQAGTLDSALGRLDHNAARFVLQARDQFLRLLEESGGLAAKAYQPLSADEAVLRSLLPAFSDRLARRREKGDDRAVMVGGRGVRLSPASGVHEGKLFLCLVVDDAQPEAIVRSASRVERDWLPAERIRTSIEVSFDDDTEQVVALRTVRFEDLVLMKGRLRCRATMQRPPCSRWPPPKGSRARYHRPIRPPRNT